MKLKKLLKSQVKAHTRTLNTGAIISVKDYNDKRTKKPKERPLPLYSVRVEVPLPEARATIDGKTFQSRLMFNHPSFDEVAERKAVFGGVGGSVAISREASDLFFKRLQTIKDAATTGYRDRTTTLQTITPLLSEGATLTKNGATQYTLTAKDGKQLNLRLKPEVDLAKMAIGGKPFYLSKKSSKRLSKSQVKGHIRKQKDGKISYVREYTTNTPSPVSTLVPKKFPKRLAKDRPLKKNDVFPKPSIEKFKKESPNDPLKFILASIIWELTPDKAAKADSSDIPSNDVKLAKQAVRAKQYDINANYSKMATTMKNAALGKKPQFNGGSVGSRAILDNINTEIHLRDQLRRDAEKHGITEYEQGDSDAISGLMLEKFIAGYIKVNGLSFRLLKKYVDKVGNESPEIIKNQWDHAKDYFQGKPKIEEIESDSMKKPDSTGYRIPKKPRESEIRAKYRYMGNKEIRELIDQLNAEYQEKKEGYDYVRYYNKPEEQYQEELQDYNRRFAAYKKRRDMMSKQHTGFDVKPAKLKKKVK